MLAERQIPELTGRERAELAALVAARVDELEDTLRGIERADELEMLVSLVSLRFQAQDTPGGAAEVLVSELERRGSPRAATALAGLTRLCAPPLAGPAAEACARLARAGVAPALPAGFGLVRAADVRRARLARAELWSFGIEREGGVALQAATLVLVPDEGGPLLAQGLLSGPLAVGELDSLRPGAGQGIEYEPVSVAEAGSALAQAAARNRELRLAVPHALALALPVVALALGLEPGRVAGLLVAPEGEELWAPPEDERAFATLAGRTLEDFEDWGTADGRPHIEAVARSGWRVGAALLEYAWRANDGSLAHWTRDDLVDAFLWWIPREEVLTHEEMRDAPDVAKELVTYLAEQGALSGDDLPALHERCDALRPDLEEAWTDRSHRGPAQSLLMQMREEGLDPADPEALEAWLADFNSRPREERDAVLGPPLETRARETRADPQRKTKRRTAKAARRRNRRR